MSDVVGWSVLGKQNRPVLVCAKCMEADTDFGADLFGAADWAAREGLASTPPTAGEVLAEHPEARMECHRCGKPLKSPP